MKTTSNLYKTIGTGLAWCDKPCELVCTRRYAATLPDKDKYPSISGDKCKSKQYQYNVTFTV